MEQAAVALHREVVINPAKICQPIGAMYATLGIQQAVPLVQGSQGCCTYVRYQFNRHFREPVNIAVTSFHEDAAVFGGRKNLLEGLRNLYVRYRPRVVGVVTTCSSETIGDDIETFIKEALEAMEAELGPEGVADLVVVPIHTPSYAGSHVKGYDNAALAYVRQLAAAGAPSERLNVIPGLTNPGDIEEVKRLLGLLGVEPLVLFDISRTLNAPLALPRPLYPEGGTSVEDLRDCANSLGSVALCRAAGGSAATYLLQKFNRPALLGPLPVGVENTDRWLAGVAEMTGKEIPESIRRERGILLDAMADTAQYTMLKKFAVFGDPDHVLALARFGCELGMEPVAVCSGTEAKELPGEMEALSRQYGVQPEVLNGGDLYALEEVIRRRGIDILLGNSKGADIAQEARVPLVRVGFPVYDRVGHQRRPIVGYNGSLHLLDQIVNSMLDFHYPEEKLQQ